MFKKIFEFLYIKVFVNIIMQDTKTFVYIENISNNKTVTKVQESFETAVLSSEMYEFISKYIDESPYHYISILNPSHAQGAIPTCDKSKEFYYADVSESLLVCINRWSTYTPKKELKSLDVIYRKIGLDFIFSPFTILSTFFKKEITQDVALYILLEEQNISVMIFKNAELLYAKYMNVEDEPEDDSNLLTYDVDLDDGIDLEDIDAMEDIDMFDDFNDIEDLDDISEIDEFSDSKDIEDDFSTEDVENSADGASSQADTFTADYQRFSLIQTAINSFYNDEKYESLFLENAYIADSTGAGTDLTQYLEEEMFLTIHFRVINLGAELSQSAQEELNI
ncbi:MAG: hypothetical protein U9P38_03970 [Campylobacterota bacterium]|nr:hypothetical protein [Campylobacterota bacterium]